MNDMRQIITFLLNSLQCLQIFSITLQQTHSQMLKWTFPILQHKYNTHITMPVKVQHGTAHITTLFKFLWHVRISCVCTLLQTAPKGNIRWKYIQIFGDKFLEIMWSAILPPMSLLFAVSQSCCIQQACYPRSPMKWTVLKCFTHC
jgi:hypothetical protein